MNLSDLSGAGKPLQLDDDSMIPKELRAGHDHRLGHSWRSLDGAELAKRNPGSSGRNDDHGLRAAYRILKNSGFLPPEIQLRKEIHEAEQLLLHVEDAAERARALLRLEMLRMRLQTSRQQPSNLHLEEQYYQQLVERLERTAK